MKHIIIAILVGLNVVVALHYFFGDNECEILIPLPKLSPPLKPVI